MGYVKKIKRIVRQCVAMDLLDKDPFIAFKITIRDVQRNLLTQDELDILRLKSLSIVRIGIVRDIFLFCCYTGLSFSDVEKLNRSEIVKGSDGNYWIYTTRKKTCSASRIPFLRILIISAVHFTVMFKMAKNILCCLSEWKDRRKP